VPTENISSKVEPPRFRVPTPEKLRRSFALMSEALKLKGDTEKKKLFTLGAEKNLIPSMESPKISDPPFEVSV